MGITIHYTGKAKSLEAIDMLINELKDLAGLLKKKCWVVDEVVKGKMEPMWGYGYGYIPTEEVIAKERIEYFSKMVSGSCNGYFKIWGKYANEVRKAFQEGKKPTFTVNTRVKGIHLNLHKKCETLSFVFDLNTLELANYARYDHKPGMIYYYSGFCCKTQFVGLPIHILVCRILKRLEKYIDFTDISDEGNYYHTQNIETARKAFGVSTAMIENVKKTLKDYAKGTDFQVVSTDELL